MHTPVLRNLNHCYCQVYEFHVFCSRQKQATHHDSKLHVSIIIIKNNHLKCTYNLYTFLFEKHVCIYFVVQKSMAAIVVNFPPVPQIGVRARVKKKKTQKKRILDADFLDRQIRPSDPVFELNFKIFSVYLIFKNQTRQSFFFTHWIITAPNFFKWSFSSKANFKLKSYVFKILDKKNYSGKPTLFVFFYQKYKCCFIKSAEKFLAPPRSAPTQ